MDSNTYVYDEKILPIDAIDFSILGNDEIKRISALGKDSLGIDIPDLYDNMEPKRGGLIDTRLGTSNHHIDCATCGLNDDNCVGHFGHIALAEPAFHIGYLDYVKKILSCICLRCSKLLVYKNEDEIKEMLKNKTEKARWAEIKNISKNVSYCQKQYYGCGTPVSKIKLEIKKASLSINLWSETKLTGVQTEDGKFDGKKTIRQILTPEICYDILKNISDNDCMILGIDPKKSRPEMLIHRVFPVPPVSVRPSVKADFMASSTMEDDLTVTLAEVVKANVRMRKSKESTGENTGKYGHEYGQLLQYHVARYIDNESMVLPRAEQRGKSSKSIVSRLKGKEGRIRGNLMGKRVDFSARTVITPDATIDINELGVPIKVAMNLTFPETVTPYNIEKLQLLVKNGRSNYPGANYVYPISAYKSGRRGPIDLRYRKEKVELHFGDIVARHLVNGDYVLLNRQPSLHKLSMMGHRIKVIENEALATFRLNPNVTPPYNADFDGDEMNIFVPQSIQARIELEEIADVKKQIISPRTGGPIVGAVQDNVLGAYNMTHENMKVDWQDAMNIASYTDFIDYVRIKKDKDMSGIDLFSLILPDDMNTKIGELVIENGRIIKGRIKKTHIGGQSNGLIHQIWDEYGADKTADFLNNIQMLINNFNFVNGFTVGIGDVAISKKLEKEINIVLEKNKLEVDHIITDMEKNPDIVDSVIFEDGINAQLSSLSSNMSALIMNNLDPSNNFDIMISSGSKGKESNMGQMSACIGQQAVLGSRIAKKYNGRALPYFHQNDDSAEGRGFVASPFMRGANPIEFFFHNMGSREGLIDTSIKTSETGYIQRKLIKAMENAMVKYDGTVRNAEDNVLQFAFGDDGIDSIYKFTLHLNILKMGDSEVVKRFGLSKTELGSFSNFSSKANDSYLDMLLNLRTTVRNAKLQLATDNITFDARMPFPVNIPRIIRTISNKKFGKSKLTPEYILDRLDDILEYKNTKVICMTADEAKDKSSLKYRDEMILKTGLKLGLHQFLSPKITIFEEKLSKEQFDNICDIIIDSFNVATVEAGEMVGTVAGQSIGEPLTQLTLNTFHHAGIGSKGTAELGVGRFREILSLSKNMKTPRMMIYLEDKYRSQKEVADKIASHAKFTTLGDLRDKIDIFYDPGREFMEKDKVYNLFYANNPSKYSCQTDIKSLPWLARIELNKENMMDKNTSLLDIKLKFCAYWNKRYKATAKGIKKEERELIAKITQCAILSNNEASRNPILHIRFDMSDYNFTTIVGFVDLFIDNFRLKGIEGIEDVLRIDEQMMVTFDNPDKELQTIPATNNFVIETKGINLVGIRYVNGVDLNKTIGNDIVMIYEKFGIEATRLALIKEISKVLGSGAGYQHFTVLVDIMTNAGTLVSIDRHGLNKQNTSPFTRASFEKPVNELMNAAVFGETDHMDSVSSRIMAGLVIKGGTGLCNVVLDNKLLENSEYTEDIEQKYFKTFNELGEDEIIQDIVEKEPEEDEIFIPM